MMRRLEPPDASAGLIEDDDGLDEPPDASTGLIEDGNGLVFQHLGAAEAEFLYEEIVVRQTYMQHGVALPRTGRPTVIDVGANIGLFSLFCHRTNPRCRLVAVEPAPAAFAVLERNLSHIPAARCVQRALAEVSAASASLLYYPDAPAESSRHPRERAMQRARLREAGGASDAGAGAAVAVACVVGTLHELFEEERLERVDLLKIDCEGDELRVLHGVRPRDWRRVRQVSVEVHDIYGRLRSCVALLRRHGFRVAWQQQRGGTEQGYRMVVPDALRLFHVYAVKRGRRLRPRRRAHPRTAPSTALLGVV